MGIVFSFFLEILIKHGDEWLVEIGSQSIAEGLPMGQEILKIEY